MNVIEIDSPQGNMTRGGTQSKISKSFELLKHIKTFIKKFFEFYNSIFSHL